MTLPKPHPSPIPPPRRLPRRKAMTLIAAFRCKNNGVLLCADRAEEDGYAKRPMDKIYRITGLFSCEVFIAGSGTTAAVKDAWADIEQSLFRAAAEGKNIYSDHQSLIELSLKNIHARHKEDLKLYPLGLLIVVAPRTSQGKVPLLLYRTDKALLIPEQLYAAYGSGKTIADYLADPSVPTSLRPF